MSEFTISIDAGNGVTNAVLAQKNGKYKSVAFPSVRATASGDTLGLSDSFEMQYEYADWGNFRYVWGDAALKVSRRALERHQGYSRYADEHHLFLISVALGLLIGKKGGSVDLTLFAPPGLFKDAQDAIQKRFKEIGNKLAIKFKNDKKPRIFTIENLSVFPEGLGAMAAYLLDKNGKPLDTDVLSGECLALDSGMFTLDALLMIDGKFSPESLSHATFENTGIKAHILEPVLQTIKKSGIEDFDLISTDDIDLCLRQGLETGDYILKSGASEADIKPLIDKYSARYAEYISNQVIDNAFNGLRGIRHVILVGGGATLIREHLLKWYPDKILDTSKYKQVKGIEPIFLNSIGGLRLALSKELA